MSELAAKRSGSHGAQPAETQLLAQRTHASPTQLLSPATVTCKWLDGDGTGPGAKETFLGYMPHDKCALAVKYQVPTANGATFSNTGGSGCYAEFGMTGPNGSTAWQTCMFDGSLGRAAPYGTE